MDSTVSIFKGAELQEILYIASLKFIRRQICFKIIPALFKVEFTEYVKGNPFMPPKHHNSPAPYPRKLQTLSHLGIFYNKEEVEMAVREWFRMHVLDL